MQRIFINYYYGIRILTLLGANSVTRPPRSRQQTSLLLSSELITKQYKKLCRQLASLEKGVVAASRWPLLNEEAHLMTAYLHTYNKKAHILTLPDGDDSTQTRIVKIDPRKTPQKRIQELYAAVKKHKASLIRLERQIAEKKALIANFETIPQASQPLPSPHKKEPYLKFVNSQGKTLLVGKNAKGNDLITFHLARGNDLWFHAAHEKGAHVVVKLARGEICDPETLEDALQLALKHSKTCYKGEAEIVWAIRKQVSRPPRAQPGQVQVAQPRYRFVKKNEARLKKLGFHS